MDADSAMCNSEVNLQNVPDKLETRLVEAAVEGDLESFGELCQRHYATMVAIGYSVLGDHQLAEDASQETFARALINIRKLKNKNKFASWLTSICRNVAKDMLSEKNAKLSKEALLQIKQEKNESDHKINQAIESLPSATKELVVLRYYDGLSYEQISSVLGISKASINGRLTRAKRKMAKYLGKMDLSENQL